MRQVFSSPELNFSARGALRDVLALHHIHPDEAFDDCVEVHFDDQGNSVAGRVLGDLARDHPWQNRLQAELAHGRLAALKTAPHKLWASVPAPAGKNRVGGAAPKGFALPGSYEFASGYGYLGTLCAADPAFAHLPHDLHLIWPFFCDAHPPLFLEVSDPLAPQLLPRTGSAMVNADTGEVEPLDEDEVPEEADEIADLFVDTPAAPRYDSYRFDMMRPRDTSGFGEEDGVCAGVPIWVSYPEIPLDPETLTPMRFLARIALRPRLSRLNATPGAVFHPAFERMSFAGEGVVFVFVSESARTLCLLAQSR